MERHQLTDILLFLQALWLTISFDWPPTYRVWVGDQMIPESSTPLNGSSVDPAFSVSPESNTLTLQLPGGDFDPATDDGYRPLSLRVRLDTLPSLLLSVTLAISESEWRAHGGGASFTAAVSKLLHLPVKLVNRPARQSLNRW